MYNAGTNLEFFNEISICFIYTSGVLKKIPSVYTLLIHTIYLSHSTQVDWRTFSRKHTVCKQNFLFRAAVRRITGKTLKMIKYNIAILLYMNECHISPITPKSNIKMNVVI